MTNQFESLNETNSTVVEVAATKLYGKNGDGIAVLKTTSHPVVSDNGETYSAPAIDVFENEYVLTWEVINFETTDESESCDWNNPSDIAMVF